MYVHRRTWLENGPRGLGLPYWMLEGGYMPIERVARENAAPRPSEATIQRVQAQRMAEATRGAVQNYHGAALRESAPARRAIAVPHLYTRTRGVGAYGDAAYCASLWSLLDPTTWWGSCAGQDVANVYQKVQYGTAPPPVVPAAAPSVKLVTAAAAAADPNAVYAGKDSTGADVYAIPSTAAENQAATVQAQNAAIDQAIAQGYNPAGNLPVNALDLDNFWKKYGTWILIGGAAVGGLALVSTVKRF